MSATTFYFREDAHSRQLLFLASCQVAEKVTDLILPNAIDTKLQPYNAEKVKISLPTILFFNDIGLLNMIKYRYYVLYMSE